MKSSTIQKQKEMFCECCWGLNALYEEYAKANGSSFSTLYVLQIILSYPGTCTQKLICEQTFLPKQTVNVIITGFLKQGFIELKELDSDRRVKIVSLTKAGKKYADKILLKLNNAEFKTMEQLKPEERISLIENYCKYKELLADNLRQ